MCFACDFWCWLMWDCVPLNKTFFLEENNQLKAKIRSWFWCLYNNDLCRCFSSPNQLIAYISCLFSNLLQFYSCFRNLLLPPWIPHLLPLKGWKSVWENWEVSPWNKQEGDQQSKAYLLQVAKEQNLMEVRSLMKEQRLKRFLEMSGNIYPDCSEESSTLISKSLVIIFVHMWKGWTWRSLLKFGLQLLV